MRELLLGEYIKRKRLDMGITQEQLCEGICEPITVSRMENNKQMPAYNRIRAFLQRLGLPDNRFYALLSKNEMEMKTLQDEINADLVRMERAAPENVTEKRAEGLRKLERLEEIADPEDVLSRQFIITYRAALGRTDGPYSPEEKLNMQMEAIRLTCPRFDPEEINLELYSFQEITIINRIANAYDDLGMLRDAINIFEKLLKYVQKHYKEMSTYSGKLTIIAKNYSALLTRVNRYDDAIEIAELGRRTCAEYGHYQFLPALLHIMGECFYLKGETEKCKEYFKYAWCIYKSVGNDRDRISLENSISKYFGTERIV